MIRHTLAAAALLFATPALAQSQADLDARYDRALAAGYKALFLCGALNSDARHVRDAASIEEWELTGVYSALDPIVRTLEHRLEYGTDTSLDYVAVDWSETMPARVAVAHAMTGCSLLPIGADAPTTEEPRSMPIDRVGDESVYPLSRRIVRRVDEVARGAMGGGYGADARTTAVLVRQGDVTLGEAFAPGFDANLPQRTWSVAKSMAATLVGVAVRRGEVTVEASAGLGLSESDPRRAITIDQLLRMASGRYSDTPGSRTDPLYLGGTTVGESALGWPLINPPGSTFRYANNDTLAAVVAISPGFAEHPPAELFNFLGMHQTVAETDWQGDYILSSQVWTTAADLARFGQLYLNDGVWRGTRVLPEGWVDYVSTPSGPQPGGALGYGAGWWLMNNSEGIPADTIAAQGNRGQYVVVVPSRDVVIVRRGEDPDGGSGFDIVAFTRDVLAALPQ
ncbi:serine hydrolase domain-containing protein [Aurantiacibacter luteus]|uniref:Beta-lactamase n=1 Tax=Aurantiacibacter luteus TaxID=1581420 RepID=A0A0G9MZ84_9SPHN|nr:serine hydrolase [Aurantiacibacter luteus]KLE35859.1 beta-lactamase [Aurantiacibacter luteus]